mmetsp:Transcript_14031/g.20412  ORF Transcript_14031/g.20412 Transcript_14031/m.20412 type:complete len:231 (+) Transcript_14031:89-781(+)
MRGVHIAGRPRALLLVCAVTSVRAFSLPTRFFPAGPCPRLQLRGGAKEERSLSSRRDFSATMTVTPTTAKVDCLKCMGDWYVQVAIPTPFDKTAHNGLEEYTWNEKKQRVDVKYTFNDGSFTGKQTVVYQKGRVNSKVESGAQWQVKPWIGFFYLPMWLDYYIVDIDTTDYSYLVASSPETTGFGAWMYIMTRQQVVTDEYLEPLRASAANAGWDMTQAVRVPQQPTPAT